MTRFVRATTRPVLIIGGVATALAGIAAFSPRLALEQMLQIAFVPDYRIIVQHWGMMIFLMGLFMVASAFRESWRPAVLLYCLMEKGFMVWLFVVNMDEPFARGFSLAAVMDGLIVGWLVLYFLATRRERPRPPAPDRA